MSGATPWLLSSRAGRRGCASNSTCVRVPRYPPAGACNKCHLRAPCSLPVPHACPLYPARTHEPRLVPCWCAYLSPACVISLAKYPFPTHAAPHPRRWYYDPETQWYYGGEPTPQWTQAPPLPAGALFGRARHEGGPVPQGAAGAGAAAGGTGAAGSAAAGSGGGAAGAGGVFKTQVVKRVVAVPKHPLAGLGGYQAPTSGKVGGGMGAGEGRGERAGSRERGRGRVNARGEVKGRGQGGGTVMVEGKGREVKGSWGRMNNGAGWKSPRRRLGVPGGRGVVMRGRWGEGWGVGRWLRSGVVCRIEWMECAWVLVHTMLLRNVG